MLVFQLLIVVMLLLIQLPVCTAFVDSEIERRLRWQGRVRIRDAGWTTVNECAEFISRNATLLKSSDIAARQIYECLFYRSDLQGWRSSDRPSLLLGDHFPVSVVPSNISPPNYWVTPVWDYVVSNFIRRDGTWSTKELELYKHLIGPGAVFCDLGAHVGSYTVPMAAHVGLEGKVYAFEPFRLVFQQLMANTAINGLSNVYGYNVALGSRAETLRVRSPDLTGMSNIGATSVYNQARAHSTSDQVLQYDGEEDVKLITLDSLHLERVDLMKVDVEGMLDEVLLGANHTIRKHRPLVALESTKPAELLIEQGYWCMVILPQHDLQVCVPEERWF
eukprot:TRINITY_DN22354_c0_g1_i1.p1 TRINITY_DN22354_c0_g1~~TRINITY_DN22354_c0_g1_i1.p1  ORF type:complete len:334 (+),score=32.46 TRINITY_DN22354_c0_g1_i1:205-1206(+)